MIFISYWMPEKMSGKHVLWEVTFARMCIKLLYWEGEGYPAYRFVLGAFSVFCPYEIPLFYTAGARPSPFWWGGGGKYTLSCCKSNTFKYLDA